jgi:zinc/manganese transport system substrate-binding protein
MRRISTKAGKVLGTAAALAVVFAFQPLARADLRVIATTPDLAAVARELGGNLVSVQAMSLASQDPHFVDAKPSLALELNRADLLLLVGLDLEVGWLPTLMVGSRNAKVQVGARGYLDCSQFVQKLQVATGPVDRSMGDIHPQGNPHYMTDPRVVAAVARGIADRLVMLDAARASTYKANLATFLQRLEAARKTWEARMAPFQGAPVIEYHRTLTYLASWLGLVEAGYLEPKPGVPPNPTHVAQLLALARARKVRAVIQEEKYPDTTSRLVATKIPAALVRIPGGTDFHKGQRYVDYMNELINRIAGALKQGSG